MKFISEITVETMPATVATDTMVCAAAHVSTKGNLAREEVDNEAKAGLINYLVKHRHGTPFEHNMFTFFVHAPIFVWREWHRHRIGFSYNEESGRYKQLDPVFYIPPVGRPMMKEGDDWKPGRPKFRQIKPYEIPNYEALCENLQESYSIAYSMYELNLGMGFDPGLARDCLPLGIFSSCWVTCNARSLMAFLSLRTFEPVAAKFVSYPLWEIDNAARQVEAAFAELMPLTHEAFVKNGRVAP